MILHKILLLVKSMTFPLVVSERIIVFIRSLAKVT